MKAVFFIVTFLNSFSIAMAQGGTGAYQLAWQALRESRFEDGLKHIDRAAHFFSDQKKPDSLAQALALKATIIWEKQEWTDAKIVIDTAMQLTFRQLPQTSPGRTYLNAVAGSLYASQYHFDTARLYYDRAMQAADTLRPSLPLVILFANLSKMANLQGDASSGMAYYKRAYDNAVALEGKEGMLVIDIMPVQIQNLTIGYQFNEALKTGLHLEQLLLRHYQADNIKMARNYANISAACYNLSRYEEGLTYRRKALQIYQFHKSKGHANAHSFYVSYYSMGQLYYYLNEYSLAKQYLDKALSQGSALFGRHNIAMVPMLIQYASSLRKLKKFEESHQYFREAYDLQHLLNPDDQSELAYIETFYGDLFADQNNYDSSLAYYSRADKRYQLIGEAYSYYGIYNRSFLAYTYSLLGKGREALTMQRDNLVQMRQHFPELQKPVIEFLNDIAETFSRTPHLDSALLYSDSVFFYASSRKIAASNAAKWLSAIPFSYSVGEQIKVRLGILTSLYEKTSDPKYLREIIDWVTAYADYVAANLYLLRTQSSLVEQSSLNKEIFAFGIDACWLLSREEKNAAEWLRKAFTFSEQSKALLLRLASNNFLVDEELNASDRVVRRDVQWRKEISSLNEQHLNAEDARDSLAEVLATAIEHYKRFQDSLKRIDHPYLKKRYDLTSYDLNEIRNHLLKNGQTLIEYALTNQGLYTFVVTSDSFYCRRSETSIMEEVKKLQNPQNLTPEEFAGHSLKLYDSLLKPVAPYFRSRRLMVVPDGELYYLNFETLVKSNKGGDFSSLQYAIRDYNFSYLLSANAALQLEGASSKKEGTDKVLVFVPVFTDEMKQPFKTAADTDSSFLLLYRQPFALRAANSIQKITPADMFIGQKAIEDQFKRSAPTYKVLHLGTHAQLNDNDPLRSRLFFARDKSDSTLTEDGNLYAYEVYTMQLRAQLAVLTACETGVGKVQSGEGGMSLAYSFLYAGCPSVVMSLWKIDEKTNAAIISCFYENLKAGDDKSEALRKAKLRFLEEHPGELSNPFYWGGLCLIGSDMPIYEGRLLYYLLGGLTILVIITVIVLRKRKKSGNI